MRIDPTDLMTKDPEAQRDHWMAQALRCEKDGRQVMAQKALDWAMAWEARIGKRWDE